MVEGATPVRWRDEEKERNQRRRRERTMKRDVVGEGKKREKRKKREEKEKRRRRSRSDREETRATARRDGGEKAQCEGVARWSRDRPVNLLPWASWPGLIRGPRPGADAGSPMAGLPVVC